MALERAKLKKLSGSVPEAHTLSQNAAAVFGNRASNAVNQISESEQNSVYQMISGKGVSEVQVPLENDFWAADSSYSVEKNDVKQISITAPNKHIHLKDNLSSFVESERKSHNSDESGQSLTNSVDDSMLPKTLPSSPKAKACLIPEATEKSEAYFNTIPRLSLEHANDVVYEERIIVTKDVKEVCNSTIKESSTDRSETQIIGPSKNSRGRDDSKRSLPQTG